MIMAFCLERKREPESFGQKNKPKKKKYKNMYKYALALSFLDLH